MSDKLESIREEDYGQCDSPKAKKVFINMLDSHMHSPSLQSKQPKMKSVDGKSINLSSPSSYNSSSPSSTSSLSSTSNVQHQKQSMAGQALNGSSEYISKREVFTPSNRNKLIHRFSFSARNSQHAKLQSPSANAKCKSSKSFTSFDAFEFRQRIAIDVNGFATRLGTSAISANASTRAGERATWTRHSRRASFDSNAAR
jgi:hypothetical protein